MAGKQFVSINEGHGCLGVFVISTQSKTFCRLSEYFRNSSCLTQIHLEFAGRLQALDKGMMGLFREELNAMLTDFYEQERKILLKSRGILLIQANKWSLIERDCYPLDLQWFLKYSTHPSRNASRVVRRTKKLINLHLEIGGKPKTTLL